MLDRSTPIGLLAPITWPIPPPGYGPWERVVANLAKGLVGLGFDNVTLYATADARVPGVRTVWAVEHPLGDPPGREAAMFERLHIEHACHHAAREGILVHNHFNYPPLERLAKRGVPVVTTLHGSAAEPAARAGYLRHRDLPYVSISNKERELLPELRYEATVFNGLDFDRIPFGPRGHGYLVTASRIDPQKGVHNAIELAQRAGMPLRIAGPIPAGCQPYFDEKIAPRLSSSIEYLGPLSASDLAALVGGASATVGLVEWEEPFGLSIAESMAAGTPVIASPRGAHPEIVEDGVTGILASDAAKAAARMDEVLALSRARCREAARNRLSLERMALGYAAVYEKVLWSNRSERHLAASSTTSA